MKEWRYIKPLETESLISDVEGQLGFKFTDSYVDFVKKYNGSRPPLSVFTTDSLQEKTIKSFLSFNPGDVENIVKLNRGVAEISEMLVAFAIDNFGNYICFDRKNNMVLFLDFETGETELIDKSFSDFLLKIDS
ncbi:SMI1/KNR4 family protein [Shewanella algae]|uniref:SMI1 / KNR4 family n=1 Tax=Shewanella algae TaxID=38313 RepID=A0A379Z299_9GAMM|nr:SMI1/KNR4 family protein [Shewanella algae]MBO2608500.1 SMI1/KNR4 family protein [Shewanella algae]SUI54026.1 SMI1 / KNR4 family [Shewanella algae]